MSSWPTIILAISAPRSVTSLRNASIWASTFWFISATLVMSSSIRVGADALEVTLDVVAVSRRDLLQVHHLLDHFLVVGVDLRVRLRGEPPLRRRDDGGAARRALALLPLELVLLELGVGELGRVAGDVGFVLVAPLLAALLLVLPQPRHLVRGVPLRAPRFGVALLPPGAALPFLDPLRPAVAARRLPAAAALGTGLGPADGVLQVGELGLHSLLVLLLAHLVLRLARLVGGAAHVLRRLLALLLVVLLLQALGGLLGGAREALEHPPRPALLLVALLALELLQLALLLREGALELLVPGLFLELVLEAADLVFLLVDLLLLLSVFLGFLLLRQLLVLVLLLTHLVGPLAQLVLVVLALEVLGRPFQVARQAIEGALLVGALGLALELVQLAFLLGQGPLELFVPGILLELLLQPGDLFFQGF